MRRSIRGFVAALTLSSVLIPLGIAANSFGAASAAHQPAVEVRSILTGEWSLPRPAGLAYFPEQRALLVSGVDTNDTSVLRLTPREDSLGTALLPRISHPATVAFDALRGRLTAVSGNELISVEAPELGKRRPAVDMQSIAALGLLNPQGATFDEATGTWFILDDEAKSILQVSMPDGSPATHNRIVLGGLGALSLRGIALNPSDGLLYVGSPDEDLLYGLDGSGAIQKTYDLTGVELEDLRAMVFAPSTDPTDDPEATHLFMADSGGALDLGKVSEVSLDAVSSAAPTVLTTIVQTIDTSQLNPPSPDPSGITYFPATDRLEVSDAEVEEMSIYEGVNLYQLSRTGSLTDTGDTTDYSNEPTGLGFNPANQTLFVSDDNQARVFMVRPGPDGRFGTGDDVSVGSIDVSTFSLPVDAEGVDYDPASGDVFIVDGIGREVWRVDPGPNGTFGNADDIVSHFDVGVFGALDPEGIGHDAEQDTLLVLDNNSNMVYEVTKTGQLERTIDVSIVPTRRMAGITLAPGTDDPDTMNLWIAARGIDNNADPNENDGKVHELSISGGPSPSPSPTPGTLDKPVLASEGDVEERPNGNVLIPGNDLELINDSGSKQVVGLRFRAITVPKAASVVNAYVQFQADEATPGPTNLTIAAQAADNAPAFTTAAFNVSSRPRTSVSVNWVPPPWTVIGQSGVNERTPNLEVVVEAIFNRPGWASGNALVLIFTGTGKRVAESFDSGSAPVLHIEYQSP